MHSPCLTAHTSSSEKNDRDCHYNEENKERHLMRRCRGLVTQSLTKTLLFHLPFNLRLSVAECDHIYYNFLLFFSPRVTLVKF